MILNLNPEQFLLVYNYVSNSPNSIAQELKTKMDLTLLEVLSSIDDKKAQFSFLNWLKQEKEKIRHMENELEIIKENIKINQKVVHDDANDGLYFPVIAVK